ncbi:hypothetical protein NDU88_007073 [Pleurodeles waltl]|uniref:Uncharacterized protein n=1 Tax=Pleurodeles waltl TaxID=8319 RepID=A0AAV7UQ03_PLEWA|nr:hypothetical protein NDU88_007073 [Pleurodeles waltl]
MGASLSCTVSLPDPVTAELGCSPDTTIEGSGGAERLRCGALEEPDGCVKRGTGRGWLLRQLRAVMKRGGSGLTRTSREES